MFRMRCRLRDQHVARGRGRPEARALLIFSPDGFYAEALVAAAASMVFSAGRVHALVSRRSLSARCLNPSEAEIYAEVCDLIDRLAGATGCCRI